MRWVMRPLRLSSIVVFAVVLLTFLAPDAYLTRLVVGLPLVLLLPGRAIVLAFDPRRALGRAERFTISVALSMCVAVMLGMALAVSPASLTAEGCVLGLGAVTLIAEAIALIRGAETSDTPAEQTAPPVPAFARPLVVLALSFAAMAVVLGVATRNATFTPSSGDLVQMWMLPKAAPANSVEIGVENTVSNVSEFTLQYYQGSRSASDTVLMLKPGETKTLTRTPLLETTGTPLPLTARIEAGGQISPRTVSWWLR